LADPFPRFSPNPLPAGSRVACRVEYDGRSYSGWQAQPHLPVDTVQETLEAALSQVAAQPLRCHCAGRTDTGVHGFAQIVHFDDPVGRSPKSWVHGTNASLPPSVRVHWAVAVAEEFHARFSALSRRYRYIIVNSAIRPALLTGLATWQRLPLDAGLMHTESQSLLGEQDFSAFRAASCQSPTPMRNVQQISVSRSGDLIAIDITANAFLHHMVRNIAGALMAVGCGKQQPGWLGELLVAGDRTQAADTAAPDGLYLLSVDYDERWGLPGAVPGPPLYPA
jgi:tRNA pseudouridine38-40 synthase